MSGLLFGKHSPAGKTDPGLAFGRWSRLAGPSVARGRGVLVPLSPSRPGGKPAEDAGPTSLAKTLPESLQPAAGREAGVYSRFAPKLSSEKALADSVAALDWKVISVAGGPPGAMTGGRREAIRGFTPTAIHV